LRASTVGTDVDIAGYGGNRDVGTLLDGGCVQTTLAGEPGPGTMFLVVDGGHAFGALFGPITVGCLLRWFPAVACPSTRGFAREEAWLRHSRRCGRWWPASPRTAAGLGSSIARKRPRRPAAASTAGSNGRWTRTGARARRAGEAHRQRGDGLLHPPGAQVRRGTAPERPRPSAPVLALTAGGL
jgi:hypothetical protein